MSMYPRMEEAEKRVLQQFRHRLTNEIIITESFLSAFCERNILDDEMTAIVKNELNYVAKANRLLELLPKRGSKAFTTLLEILQITNPWLAEKMKTSYIEEKNREAKLRISPAISASATIEGYATTTAKQIDNDIKQRTSHFADVNLSHLSEREQRNIEKWLGEEIMKERRRQQNKHKSTFIDENGTRASPHIFLNTKETQTDTNAMELQELYEDIAIHQYGTDVDFSMDVSFKLIRDMVLEVLGRMDKLDRVFIQCVEKFDDFDRMTSTLPNLIERTVKSERELKQTLMEERRYKNKLYSEKEALAKHVVQLEHDFEQMYLKQRHVTVRPQRMGLKKRQDVQVKFLRVQTDANTQIISERSPNQTEHPSTTEESSNSTRGRTTHRHTTTRSSSRPHRRNISQGSQSNIKVHKSTFDTVRFESASPRRGTSQSGNRNLYVTTKCG